MWVDVDGAGGALVFGFIDFGLMKKPQLAAVFLFGFFDNAIHHQRRRCSRHLVHEIVRRFLPF